MTTLTLNSELNGIEVKFDKFPGTGTTGTLKANGFRWHHVKKLWYAKNTADRLQIAQQIAGEITENAVEVVEAPKAAKKEKVNMYGVKVGDLFKSSWGYDQTNAEFYQVIEICGAQMVRLVEVRPERISTDWAASCAEEYTVKLTNEILPEVKSCWIPEGGIVRKVKPGYYQAPEEAAAHCWVYITKDKVISASKVSGETAQVYTSSYH